MITLLTPRQLELVKHIRQYQQEHNMAPTMQELGDKMGVTKVTIHEHIHALVEKGAIIKRGRRSRSLELSPSLDLPNERNSRLPFVGNIAAGSPIEAIQDDQYIDIEDLFGQKSTGARFVLKAVGDSMIDDCIADGDYVLCEKRSHIHNGDIVVALVKDHEATLKRFFREGENIRLQPANPNMQPMIHSAKDIQIQGVCIGIMRTL